MTHHMCWSHIQILTEMQRQEVTQKINVLKHTIDVLVNYQYVSQYTHVVMDISTVLVKRMSWIVMMM